MEQSVQLNDGAFIHRLTWIVDGAPINAIEYCNLNGSHGRIWGRIQEVGFLSFVSIPTPILPEMEPVEIMFSLILI